MEVHDFEERQNRAWGGNVHVPTPFEEIVAKEETEDAAADVFEDLVDFQRALLSYLFTDGRAEDWRHAGRRLIAFMLVAYPADLLRRQTGDLDGFELGPPPRDFFPLSDLLDRFPSQVKEPYGRVLRKYISLQLSRGWLRKAIGNFYLLARQYASWLLTEDTDFSYEKISAACGEIPSGNQASNEDLARMRDRARSRWSARARALLVAPIESVGSQAPANFMSKPASHREACRRSAMGNTNRHGKKPPHASEALTGAQV